MLTRVEVRSVQGTLLSLPLQDVSGGFVLEEIEGLDPGKAVLVSSSFALLDGQQYQSARREPRNIKFRISFEPDYEAFSVMVLRNQLYQFFMPKTAIIMTFYMNTGANFTINGVVESFETSLFSKEPVVDISVMCFDPNFYDPDLVSISGNSTDTPAEILVPYDGSIDTGMVFKINVNRSLSDFSIYHRGPDDTISTLQFTAPLLAGDGLKIDTSVGSKEVTLTRAFTESSILYGMTAQSVWLRLYPGDNYIRFYAVGAAIPFTMEYYTKYGGL
jgi:Phage tail protein